MYKLVVWATDGLEEAEGEEGPSAAGDRDVRHVASRIGSVVPERGTQ